MEKLKAHETNIMQLLQRAEEEGAVSQQMSERDVAYKANASAASGEARPSAEEIEVGLAKSQSSQERFLRRSTRGLGLAAGNTHLLAEVYSHRVRADVGIAMGYGVGVYSCKRMP